MTPTERLLRYFEYQHLPPNLQKVSRSICELAHQKAVSLPDGPEKTVGLRKLLEAKDCFVRAALDEPVEAEVEDPDEFDPAKDLSGVAFPVGFDVQAIHHVEECVGESGAEPGYPYAVIGADDVCLGFISGERAFVPPPETEAELGAGA